MVDSIHAKFIRLGEDAIVANVRPCAQAADLRESRNRNHLNRSTGRIAIESGNRGIAVDSMFRKAIDV